MSTFLERAEAQQNDLRAELHSRALTFASLAHKGQVRKYTGEAYIVHPIDVSMMVMYYTDDMDVIIASLFHDIVEDTDVPLERIVEEFGVEVGILVDELTDKSRPEDGNRAIRKAIDRDRLQQVSADAQTIKYADLISNSGSIAVHDPDFWKVYKEEKRALLDVMIDGHPDLRRRAYTMIGGL